METTPYHTFHEVEPWIWKCEFCGLYAFGRNQPPPRSKVRPLFAARIDWRNARDDIERADE